MRLRFTVFIVLVFIYTGASAQWYRLSFKKQEPPRATPDELVVADHSIDRLPKFTVDHPTISHIRFAPSDFTLEAQEAAVMKIAQHNMRFRVYGEAGHNFSELAHLYIQQKRYSEAKWYLLQSVNLSRQQNDDRLTITNLLELATLKTIMGEYPLAQEDLDEARGIATERGFNEYIDTIDLASLYLKQTRAPKDKPAMIYADDAFQTTKGQ